MVKHSTLRSELFGVWCWVLVWSLELESWLTSGTDLAQALTAYTRAIRCHRRLARLAPRFFDATVVDREVRHRAERRRRRELTAPALAKAYGREPDPSPSDPTADLPPLPSRRTQRAVERELAAWDFWMAAGRLALDRHQQRRPHALLIYVPKLFRRGRGAA